MKNSTDHQSFMLKPSKSISDGVGVFALHGITKDTQLEVFTENFQEELRDKKSVPEELRGYCLGHASGKIQCPKYFNQMDIGNYLNHSKDANIYWDGENYFAKRDIKAGEELFSNYNELEEPDEEKDNYY